MKKKKQSLFIHSFFPSFEDSKPRHIIEILRHKYLNQCRFVFAVPNRATFECSYSVRSDRRKPTNRACRKPSNRATQ